MIFVSSGKIILPHEAGFAEKTADLFLEFEVSLDLAWGAGKSFTSNACYDVWNAIALWSDQSSGVARKAVRYPPASAAVAELVSAAAVISFGEARLV